MNLKKTLDEKRLKIKQISSTIQALDEEKSKLIQEALRIDGEIRLLKDLLDHQKMEKS